MKVEKGLLVHTALKDTETAGWWHREVVAE